MPNNHYAQYIITPRLKTLFQVIEFSDSDLIPENEDDEKNKSRMVRLDNPDTKIFYSSDKKEFGRSVGGQDILYIDSDKMDYYTLHNAQVNILIFIFTEEIHP